MSNRQDQVGLDKKTKLRVAVSLFAGRCVVLGLSLALAGCSYDPDERCDSDQELYGDALRCVCKLPKVWSATGCVECPAGEVPTASGCGCAEGEVRSPEGVCLPVPEPTSAALSSSEGPDAHVGCDAAAPCLDTGANQ